MTLIHGVLKVRIFKSIVINGTPTTGVATVPYSYFFLVSKWPIFRFTASVGPAAEQEKGIEMTTDSSSNSCEVMLMPLS